MIPPPHPPPEPSRHRHTQKFTYTVQFVADAPCNNKFTTGTPWKWLCQYKDKLWQHNSCHGDFWSRQRDTVQETVLEDDHIQVKPQGRSPGCPWWYRCHQMLCARLTIFRHLLLFLPFLGGWFYGGFVFNPPSPGWGWFVCTRAEIQASPTQSNTFKWFCKVIKSNYRSRLF